MKINDESEFFFIHTTLLLAFSVSHNKFSGSSWRCRELIGVIGDGTMRFVRWEYCHFGSDESWISVSSCGQIFMLGDLESIWNEMSLGWSSYPMLLSPWVKKNSTSVAFLIYPPETKQKCRPMYPSLPANTASPYTPAYARCTLCGMYKTEFVDGEGNFDLLTLSLSLEHYVGYEVWIDFDLVSTWKPLQSQCTEMGHHQSIAQSASG